MDTVMALNRTLQNQQKNYFLYGFFSGFRLLNQFCYTHRHYFNSFGKFRVFSIHIYQLYAYHIFWARVAGSLIWACFSSKILNAAPYPREVNRCALLKVNLWILFLSWISPELSSRTPVPYSHWLVFVFMFPLVSMVLSIIVTMSVGACEYLCCVFWAFKLLWSAQMITWSHSMC
jgi:hypothetical protein